MMPPWSDWPIKLRWIEMTEKISKSAQKRRFKDEESAAAELALLSDKDLKKLPIGQAVKDEIINCRGQKGGALKRQIKYLAKVMRDDSVDEIFDFLADRKGSRLKDNKLQREVERLRDVIINEAMEDQQSCLQAGIIWEPNWQGEEINSFVHRYPVDGADLRKTVYQYVKTRIHNYNKEVFRIVKAAVEKEEMHRKME
jgi:ribosome-associated protein